jgi:hypothetical protein
MHGTPIQKEAPNILGLPPPTTTAFAPGATMHQTLAGASSVGATGMG